MRPNAFTSEAMRRSPEDSPSLCTMKKVLTIAAGKHFSLPFFMKATFLVKDAPFLVFSRGMDKTVKAKRV